MAIDIGIYNDGDWDANVISLKKKSTKFIGRTRYGYIIPNDVCLNGIGIEDTVVHKKRLKKRW